MIQRSRQSVVGWIYHLVNPTGMKCHQKARLPVLWKQWHFLALVDNVLYRRYISTGGIAKYLQLLMSRTLRRDFLREVHGRMTGGHLGWTKTMSQVQRRAYWCGWRRDVMLFCRRCFECNRYHRGNPPRHGRLQRMAVGMPMERLHIDLTGPHPRSNAGYTYILTCLDPFTKFAEGIAIRNKSRLQWLKY